jgi:hypothetical protein
MPVISMIASRALVSTTLVSSAPVISDARALSRTPTIGAHSTPSQISMTGVDSSRIAARWFSIVSIWPSRSR